MRNPFGGPISVTGEGRHRRWRLDIGDDELSVVLRLIGELRGLLTDEGDTQDGDRGAQNTATSPVLARLFPTAYPDDEEKEAEYQRLMRDELVTSRLHQIDAVTAALEHDTSGAADMTEGDVIALMQSVNAVRIVLGTIIGISDEDDDDDVDDDHPFAGEYHLYGYLSWLLDWIVRSLSS